MARATKTITQCTGLVGGGGAGAGGLRGGGGGGGGGGRGGGGSGGGDQGHEGGRGGGVFFSFSVHGLSLRYRQVEIIRRARTLHFRNSFLEITHF